MFDFAAFFGEKQIQTATLPKWLPTSVSSDPEHRSLKNISTFFLTAGILLMMALCEQVQVYEYIPSMRQTDLCHYHERYYDSACTLGAYHPLLYEKSLIQRLNTGTESDLRRRGRVTLPGLSTVDCDVGETWSELNPSLRANTNGGLAVPGWVLGRGAIKPLEMRWSERSGFQLERWDHEP